jgi:hypothetical protein
MGQGGVDAVLASLNDDVWERFSVRLKRYAFACLRHTSWADAEDISQTAFLQVIDPKLRTWNPETEPDLFTHLKALVRQEVSRRRMMFRRHRETPYEEEISDEKQSTAAEAGVDESDATPANNPYTPSHETTLLREERGGRILSLLRERYATDALMLKVLELLIARVDTTAEQAEHIGCTLVEVRNARVRLGDRVKRIEKELDAEGGSAHGK